MAKSANAVSRDFAKLAEAQLGGTSLFELCRTRGLSRGVNQNRNYCIIMTRSADVITILVRTASPAEKWRYPPG